MGGGGSVGPRARATLTSSASTRPAPACKRGSCRSASPPPAARRASGRARAERGGPRAPGRAPGSRTVAASSGPLGPLLRGVHPGLPGLGLVADGDVLAAPDERRPEEARLDERLLDEALGRVAGNTEAERLERGTLAIDQRRGAETLGEPAELAARGRTLLHVDEVHRDPALLEEALRLARLLTVGETEDLDLDHGIASRRTSRGWGPAVRGEPMFKLRGPPARREPWMSLEENATGRSS